MKNRERSTKPADTTPLLTKEEEIELAKIIEEGKTAIARVLLKTRAITDELNGLKGSLLKKKRADIAPPDDEAYLFGEDEGDIKNLLSAIEEFNSIYNSPLPKRGSREEDEERLIALLLYIEKDAHIYERVFDRLLQGEEGSIKALEMSMAQIEEAKDRLIKANQGLVASIARRYINRGLPLLDLMQEGNIGLMRAIDRFEYQRGYRLSTYASWWIRQSIYKAIVGQTRTIHIPLHMMESINRIVRMTHRLVQENGREPTPEELSEKTQIPLETISNLMNILREPVSLETPVGDEGDSSLEDFIEDTGQTLPHDEIISNELKEQIKEILSTLSPKEEKVLRMRFGIDEPKNHTVEEVGKRFGLTRERVLQIETKALRKLRHPKHSKRLGIFYEK